MSWLNFLKAETREKKKKKKKKEKKKRTLDSNSIFKYSHIVYRIHNHFIKKKINLIILFTHLKIIL